MATIHMFTENYPWIWASLSRSQCCAQLLIGTVYLMFGVYVYAFQGQFTLPIAFQGMSAFAWQVVGNALGLATGIIAAGLYGNIGISECFVLEANKKKTTCSSLAWLSAKN